MQKNLNQILKQLIRHYKTKFLHINKINQKTKIRNRLETKN